MTWKSLVLTVSLLLVPALGHGAGVNLTWDACTPEGGVPSKTFACTTNSGSETLWASFVISAAQDSFVGVEAWLDLQAQSEALPDWWQVFNDGACRQSGMSVSLDFTGAPNSACTDPWLGLGVGGLAGYHTSTTVPPVPGGNPNAAQLILGAGVASPFALAAGIEYYVFKLTLAKAKTVGDGACSGCATPACMTLNQLRVTQRDGSYEDLTQPLVSNVVSWQSGAGCGAAAPRRVTWGQVRSVLR